MDHWKRTTEQRREAWAYLTSGLGADIALLQECVPRELTRSQIVYRQIAGVRPWGSAVAAFNKNYSVEEIGAVRTRYSSTLFQMLGTYPGAVIVARVELPEVGPKRPPTQERHIEICRQSFSNTIKGCGSLEGLSRTRKMHSRETRRSCCTGP
jgi:hypothetical protein